MTDGLYNVHLAKGQGMIPETVVLLNLWQPGVSAPELRNKVVANGILPKATAYRLRFVLEMPGEAAPVKAIDGQALPIRVECD